MKIISTILLFIALIFASVPVSAQTSTQLAKDKEKEKQKQYENDKKSASAFFYYGNYRFALDKYLKLYEKDSLNINYNHKIGLCYIYTNIDKNKAIPYLEKVVSQKRFDPNAWYDLGRAYIYSCKIDDAKKAFENFINSGIRDINPTPAKRYLEYCNNAAKLIEKPIDVTFTNLGNEINSPFPDYNPYISSDESFIIFASKREGNIGGVMDYEGYVAADVYIAQRTDAEWKKTKQLTTVINSYMIEEPVGLTPDGEKLFLYFDNKIGKGDLFVSEGNGKSYKRPDKLGEKINQKYLESAATMTLDRKAIVFSSNRPGGYGGLDLWISKKLPNGEWSEPTNLGQDVNTPYNEDYPYFSPDGENLYFASTGHNSMGGYDIFKSKYNQSEASFSTPENLGYPINTPEDNTVISFSTSGRHAYIAKTNPDGIGNLDIYRITFNDIEQKKHLISGVILNIDSSHFYTEYNANIAALESINNKIEGVLTNTNKNNLSKNGEAYNSLLKKIDSLKTITQSIPDVTITVTNKLTNQIQGIYRPNKNNGRYTIIIHAGAYSFSYKCKNYETIIKEFNLHDYGEPTTILNENITLNLNENEPKTE